ncbi:[F-actin]-monooxygenase mical3 [Gaertneriomyces sp. JEL0708]|nr:[F-actin]-monooxygenase mical3 [Gaertneriomyces sp. JEL0708]
MLGLFKRGTNRVCKACRKRISSSRLVPASGTFYHRDCLKCADCDQLALYQYMPTASLDPPILLCKEHFSRRVQGEDEPNDKDAMNVCGGCRRPIMTGMPLEVEPFGDGTVEGWHQYCWKIYKIWDITLDIFKPTLSHVKDMETYAAECMLWEDRVQTVFGSLREFYVVFEVRLARFIENVEQLRYMDALQEGKDIWAQVDILMDISESGYDAGIAKVHYARSAYQDWAREIQLSTCPPSLMVHSPEDQRILDSLIGLPASFQVLTKRALIGFVRQDIHSKKLDQHLFRLERQIFGHRPPEEGLYSKRRSRTVSSTSLWTKNLEVASLSSEDAENEQDTHTMTA